MIHWMAKTILSCGWVWVLTIYWIRLQLQLSPSLLFLILTSCLIFSLRNNQFNANNSNFAMNLTFIQGVPVSVSSVIVIWIHQQKCSSGIVTINSPLWIVNEKWWQHIIWYIKCIPSYPLLSFHHLPSESAGPGQYEDKLNSLLLEMQ